MRITLLVNYDIASLYALNLLLPRLKEHKVSVFYSDKTVHRINFPKTLGDMEEHELSLLERSFSGCLSFDALEAFTDQIIRVDDVNSGWGYEQLVGAAPELMVSIHYMTILVKDVANLPKHGTLNLHTGLLPDYQGLMSAFWAMLNQEEKLGCTLHFIEDEEINAGDIVVQTQVRTQYHHSYLWNVLNLIYFSYHAVLETIALISKEQAVKRLPQEGIGHYYSYPDDFEIDQFMQQGNHLFDKSEGVKLSGRS